MASVSFNPAVSRAGAVPGPQKSVAFAGIGQSAGDSFAGNSAARARSNGLFGFLGSCITWPFTAGWSAISGLGGFAWSALGKIVSAVSFGTVGW